MLILFVITISTAQLWILYDFFFVVFFCDQMSFPMSQPFCRSWSWIASHQFVAAERKGGDGFSQSVFHAGRLGPSTWQSFQMCKGSGSGRIPVVFQYGIFLCRGVVRFGGVQKPYYKVIMHALICMNFLKRPKTYVTYRLLVQAFCNDDMLIWKLQDDNFLLSVKSSIDVMMCVYTAHRFHGVAQVKVWVGDL